jgi:hypothetical protein
VGGTCSANGEKETSYTLLIGNPGRKRPLGRPSSSWVDIIKMDFLQRLWVLRRIFGLKRDGVTGGWRKQHNEELHNLYSSPSIIRILKSRRMR